MLWQRARRSPIGVEVTSDAVRLLQLEWRGGRGRVAACAEVRREEPDAEEPDALDPKSAKAVRQALKSAPFRGRRAVINLPSDQAILRHVKVESIKGQALRDALLFELEDAFPGDTPLVQHLEVGEVMERGERRHELILLAAGLDQINRYVEWLEWAGLEPTAIDAEGCALIRCFTRRRRRSSDGDAHSAIVNIGESVTLMTITGEEQALFMKQLPIGAGHLYDAIRQRLDLSREDIRVTSGAGDGTADDDEELAQQIVGSLRLQLDSLSAELSACLRYHAASRRSPGGVELTLCGEGANIPGVVPTLAAALDTVIQRPDPFTPAYSGIESSERLAREYAAWSVPLGLALREVS
ncbi:MAG: pilus assembly protein PilM [Planctomycetota bacterium]